MQIYKRPLHQPSPAPANNHHKLVTAVAVSLPTPVGRPWIHLDDLTGAVRSHPPSTCDITAYVETERERVGQRRARQRTTATSSGDVVGSCQGRRDRG
ncbi:hypothetical protein NL676_003997 [Syzygium grande]|nr:hypothetical protein NL676_003997 [Syzygium grande]